MSVSTRRGLALVGVAALAFASPATAFAAGHSGDHSKATHQNHKHHGKPASRRFTATGTFDAVGADGLTFTMDDKGGSKDLHGKLGVVITTSSKTKVTLNDAAATLANLAPGDHVAVNGLRGPNGELDALHVNADSTPEPQPSSTASPDSTGSPAPSPTDTSSPASTPTDTTSPAATTSP